MPKVNEKSRLTLIKQLTFGLQARGLYSCICGATKELAMNTVRMNKTRSCGCLQREYRELCTKNAVTKNPLYCIWAGIKGRCYNPNNEDYPKYGGDGIYMCDEWLNNFPAFLNWCIENGWRKGLEVDKDLKGGRIYSPENCSIITPKQNSNKRRTSRMIEYNGKCQTLAMWGDELGMVPETISTRIDKLKWPIEKALTERPINKKRYFV